MSDAATDNQPPSLLGQTVGKYKVTRLIGKGGMGAVYEMVHQTIGQRAALKVLFQKYAEEPEFVARFLSEAQVVNKIEHPGLVKISDHGQLPDGALYILMEYLEGETLRGRLESLSGQGQRMPQDEAQELIRQLAETLRVVHSHSVVHRDLKPENIFLLRDPAALHGERVKILDFGIAKISDSADLGHNDSPGPLTTVGKVLGTPTYMSPEQCEGQGALTGKSDTYALGVIWFELLAGTPPFATGSANTIMAQHLLKAPPTIRSMRGDISAALDAQLARMLAKKPEERPSMAQLLDELAKLPAVRPSGTRRRTTLIAAGIAVTLAGAAFAGALWQEKARSTGRSLAGRSDMAEPTRGRTPDTIPSDPAVTATGAKPTPSPQGRPDPAPTAPTTPAATASAPVPAPVKDPAAPPSKPAGKAPRTATPTKGSGKKGGDAVHPSADDVPIVKLPDDP